MEIMQMVKDGIIVLIPALYYVGVMLKTSPIKDWLIPFILGGLGIILSFLWHLGFTHMDMGVGLVFESITQGLICAAGSVYIKNLSVQYQKRSEY